MTRCRSMDEVKNVCNVCTQGTHYGGHTYTTCVVYTWMQCSLVTWPFDFFCLFGGIGHVISVSVIVSSFHRSES